MSRVNVYPDAEPDAGAPPRVLGWFDYARASRWSDQDPVTGNGSGGVHRGQAVIRTAQGKWVLEHWTDWAGETSTRTFIAEGDAREWLIRNGEDAAVTEYFGDLAEEEDRRPGRPEIGNKVQVSLGDLLGRVDAFAGSRCVSRAEAIRELLCASLPAQTARADGDPRTWGDAELIDAHIGYGYGGHDVIDAEFWRRHPQHHGFYAAARHVARQHAEQWQDAHPDEDMLDPGSAYEDSPEAGALTDAYRLSVDELRASRGTP